MRSLLFADQNSSLTTEGVGRRIVCWLAASNSSARAVGRATPARSSCDAAKQIGSSLPAVAQKMRMLILRPMCADSPQAQNREGKERSSGRVHRSRALTALIVRGSVLARRLTVFVIGGERSAGHGEIGLLSCPALRPAMLHRSGKTPTGPLRPLE
jgi:hypothetical protein